jgi:hypothetical protein
VEPVSDPGPCRGPRPTLQRATGRPGADERGRGTVLRRVADRTRVELEHRHIDRHGPGWEAITDGVDGPQGWPLYLDRYAALVKEGG